MDPKSQHATTLFCFSLFTWLFFFSSVFVARHVIVLDQSNFTVCYRGIAITIVLESDARQIMLRTSRPNIYLVTNPIQSESFDLMVLLCFSFGQLDRDLINLSRNKLCLFGRVVILCVKREHLFLFSRPLIFIFNSCINSHNLTKSVQLTLMVLLMSGFNELHTKLFYFIHIHAMDINNLS